MMLLYRSDVTGLDNCRLGGGIVGDVAGFVASTHEGYIFRTNSYHSFSTGGQQCGRKSSGESSVREEPHR